MDQNTVFQLYFFKGNNGEMGALSIQTEGFGSGYI